MSTVRHRDILLLMDHAKKNLIGLPSGARLEGMYRDLSDGERLALSYFSAALTVVGGMGIPTDKILIKLDDSEHDPD